MAAAAQCSSLLCSCSRRPCTTRAPLSLFSPSHFLSPFTATSHSRKPQTIEAFDFQVTYLEPGQSSVIEARNGSTVQVQATAGPVLGPPWQRPENGYLVITPEGKSTLYYEPHCVCNTSSLESERADIVITPVIKQLLPYLGLRTRRCSSTCKAAECQGHCPDDKWGLGCQRASS